MKQQIYQNGFWLMLGLLIGGLSIFLCTPKHKPQPITIQLMDTIVKDSVVDNSEKNVKQLSCEVSDDTLPELTESNLRNALIEHNIPHHKIVLAQAKLESGNFNSKLTRTHQNIFGMKKGNRYRRYSHWLECVKDYKKRISSRYTGGDYFSFLRRIGYATNPNYTNLLRRMIQ